MQAFTSSDILDLWDRGAGLHPLDRSLLALSSIHATAAEDCADWALGRRNRTLFELHASCFGSRLKGWSSCPQCSEKIEFDVDSALLLSASELNCPKESVMIRGEHFRLPTSRDVAAALSADLDTSAIRLLQHCRISNGLGDEWSEDEVRDAGEKLSAADPLAETQLALDCPSCGHQRNDVLDIGCFVWAEIESRARRLLWEVHTLAAAYGWSEGETLALSSSRRANYIRLVQA
jgi:hypothetical protein